MKKVRIVFEVVALFCVAFHWGAVNLVAQEPAALTNDWRDGYSLIILNGTDVQASHRAQEFVVSQGGRVAIVVPPHVMLGWIPAEIEPQLIGKMGIVSIHRKVVDVAAVAFQDADTQAAIRFFNYVASGGSKAEEGRAAGLRLTARPFSNCVRAGTPVNRQAVAENLQKFGMNLLSNGNSDYMTGTVAVALFFVESNGAIDRNEFTWTASDEQNTYNRALDGLSWWSGAAQMFGESVSFTPLRYSATYSVCQQGYEPIRHSSGNDSLWISAIMSNLSFTSGDHFSQVTAFNAFQRLALGTDWAYSVFIAYNRDGPSHFTDDDMCAFAYLGGPYVQMLFINDGHGEEDFGKGLAHETGHIFWACDEYYEEGYSTCTCDTCAAAPGRSIPNGNCEHCNPYAVDCIMRSSFGHLCYFTPLQIGWLRTWVDFNWDGPEVGTFAFPYSTFQAGVYHVWPGGVLSIKSGESHEPTNFPMTVTKPMTIRTYSGPSTIGH
jgi:hypothetical protein